jgi:hypothetical protein
MDGKACNGVTSGAVSVATASQIVTMAEVVCRALKGTSFFKRLRDCPLLSKTENQSQSQG